MAITGPASYLSTTDEFLIHWLLANTALGRGMNWSCPAGGLRPRCRPCAMRWGPRSICS